MIVSARMHVNPAPLPRPPHGARRQRGARALGDRAKRTVSDPASPEPRPESTDLFRRGLEEMICVDGGAGLLAALPRSIPASPFALLGAQDQKRPRQGQKG